MATTNIDPQFYNKNRERQEIINRILNIYPNARNIPIEKLEEIIDGEIEQNISKNKFIFNEIILDKIKCDDKYYYKNKYGGLLNGDAELVGLVINNNSEAHEIHNILNKINPTSIHEDIYENLSKSEVNLLNTDIYNNYFNNTLKPGICYIF
jgi:hypothetical protein